MKPHSNNRDLTHRQHPGGGGSDMRLLWLCGHKNRFGKRRAGVLMLCAACAQKGKQ